MVPSYPSDWRQSWGKSGGRHNQEMQTTAKKGVSHLHVYLEQGEDLKWGQAWREAELRGCRNDQPSRLEKNGSCPRRISRSGAITRFHLVAPTRAPPLPLRPGNWLRGERHCRTAEHLLLQRIERCLGITKLLVVMLLSFSCWKSTTGRVKSLSSFSFKTSA